MTANVSDERALREFHRGIYRDAFPEQYEPWESWQRALAGEGGYDFRVDLARDEAGAIAGGICYELYPRSGCGFLTYLVVAPARRGRGIGRTLIDGAIASLRARGAQAIFAEVNDPEKPGKTNETSEEKLARVAMFARWGARQVCIEYVQPSLGPGLTRDHGLRLVCFDDREALPGALVAAFLRELYTVCEGRADEPSLGQLAACTQVETRCM